MRMHAARRGAGGAHVRVCPPLCAPPLSPAAPNLSQQPLCTRSSTHSYTAHPTRRLAVKMEPTNAALLDAYACLLAEVEDGGAPAALLKAVEVAPQSGHEKYMYLAQVRALWPAACVEEGAHVRAQPWGGACAAASGVGLIFRSVRTSM